MRFLTDSVESDNPIKNLKTLYSKTHDDLSLNCSLKMDQNPVLITGIADFVQIYASHSVFIYKSLVSINLKVVNMCPFKIENLKFKILYTSAADIFPLNSNPRIVKIDELMPYGKTNLNFCLSIYEV